MPAAREVDASELACDAIRRWCKRPCSVITVVRRICCYFAIAATETAIGSISMLLTQFLP